MAALSEPQGEQVFVCGQVGAALTPEVEACIVQLVEKSKQLCAAHEVLWASGARWTDERGEERCELPVDWEWIQASETRNRIPIWVEDDGERLRVRARLNSWSGVNVFGHEGPCATAWLCQMADDSLWIVARDLLEGHWLGGPVWDPLGAGDD